MSPLEFLAEFTQHIPAKGSHLIHYYGWYSNKSRGMRTKAAAEAAGDPSAAGAIRSEAADRCSQSCAMLIKRVYELDPLTCPECGGQMAVVAFIEPPQAEVISYQLCLIGICRRIQWFSPCRFPGFERHGVSRRFPPKLVDWFYRWLAPFRSKQKHYR